MQFIKNKIADDIIHDLTLINKEKPTAYSSIFFLIKVLSAVLNREGDKLEELWDHLSNKKSSQTAVKIIDQFIEKIKYGHTLSRGNPNSKRKALDSFKEALSLLHNLQKCTEVRDWVIIPLMTEAKSKEASIYTYTGEYEKANNKYKTAELEIHDLMNSSKWPFKGLYDKEVSLRAFHLSCFLISAQKKGIDGQTIEGIIESEFDQTVTKKVIDTLTNGSEHSSEYISPLSKWIRDQIVRNKINVNGLDYDVSNELRISDRLGYFVSCAKFIANRGWADLYLYKNLKDDKYLQNGFNKYSLAMNAIIEGFGIRDSTYFHIVPQMLDKYCNEPSTRINEVQISLSRNLFYRALLGKLSEGVFDYYKDVERTVRLYEKDKRFLIDPENGVIASIVTAQRNVSELGLAEIGKQVITAFPEPLKGIVQNRIKVLQ